MATRKVTLKDLKVQELKKILEERDCETDGRKSVLQQRLMDVLLNEGENPENFLFEIDCDVGAVLKTLEENSKILKDELLENSRTLEDKLMENSKGLEEKMMENSRHLEGKMTNIDEKMMENSRTLEEKMMENSRNLENKIINIDEKIMENSRTLRQELTESMEIKIQGVEEKLKEKILEMEKRISTLSDINKDVFVQPMPIESDDLEKLEQDTRALNLKDEVLQEQAITHPGGSKVTMKPPQFDGKMPWANYLRQFEAAAKANGWTSRDKATALTLALRGDATDILQTLSPTEQEDYQQLVRRLETRYGQAHMELVYHSQLKNRCQKTNETLQEYEADIARLVRLAYPATPENVMERLAVQAFLDGLRDQEMRQALLLARPSQLVDALVRALEFEAAKQSSRSQGRIRKIEEDTEDQGAAIRRIVKEILEDGKKQLRCWGCGELGHIKRRCKKNTQSSTPSTSEN